jgi:hypothetical protein
MKLYQNCNSEAMQWLRLTPDLAGERVALKNIDYSGYTEIFRNLQARHLNNVMSLAINRLMDADNGWS